ncbi:MAG: bifunctional diguanylate cyclase/phosphodiesterase [Roseitalea sp.]|jgi:diguanylate cyclase (GGDEF)-like protein|nr:bifunctional diguanylate cyclase/phosphodiesterase [Roseitalea sp.]MBO6721796.1 bifunctional diguanylate cyclase/phosphodiesterase [Roseitalea sp.]MBO6741596.1 bifunctional diguanylate cyclase/phosphodiesterase [Roseitalea sp.]
MSAPDPRLRKITRSKPGQHPWLAVESVLAFILVVLAAVHSIHFVLPHEILDTILTAQMAGRLELASAAVTLVIAIAICALIAERLKIQSVMQDELRLRQDTDLVSGAATRGCFLDDLKRAVADHRKRGSVALVIIDVDHLKQINDALGHGAGDDVLGFCTRIARQAFPGARVGRLGGDELAVFIRSDETIPERYVTEACSTFLATLREGLFIANRRQAVSASLGVALAPAHSDNANELLSFADLALQEAKRGGRGAWSVFSPEILADARQERFIERELRAAILLGQLSLHYQPIMDADGALNSLEALVRWQNPVRGVISPAEFIPIAEKSRLIHELGLYVLKQVCDDLETLPNVPVNVNISAWQLAHDTFLKDYVGVLTRTNVSPDRIVLEITESAMLDTSDDFIERMDAIKSAGFRIALDDFGMGYSEFNQLRKLPFDIIKIDKSYIQNIGTDVVTDTFVSAVTQIACKMERTVVAEGVETEDDRVRASVAGCRLFQGYYHQAPASRADIVALYCAKALADVA